MEEVTFLGMSMPGLIARVVTLGVAALVAAGLSHVVTRALRRTLEHTNVPSASIFVNLARALVWAFARVWHRAHGLRDRPGRYFPRYFVRYAGHGL